MEISNIKRSARFLSEKPIKVNLFDRPRLVCEIVCLEADQEDARQTHDASDALYLVVEGKGKLKSGSNVDDLEEQDVFVIPPGIDYTIENPGPNRLTVLALVTPKPSRVSEVKMPVAGRRRERPEGERPEGEHQESDGREGERSHGSDRDRGRTPANGSRERGREDRRPKFRPDRDSGVRQRRDSRPPAETRSRSPRPPSRDRSPASDSQEKPAARDFRRASSARTDDGRPSWSGGRGRRGDGPSDSRDSSQSPRRSSPPARRSAPRTAAPEVGRASGFGRSRKRPAGVSSDSIEARSANPRGPRLGAVAGRGTDSRGHQPDRTARGRPAAGKREDGPRKNDFPGQGREGPRRRAEVTGAGEPPFERGRQRTGGPANAGGKGRDKPSSSGGTPRQGTRGANKAGAQGQKRSSPSRDAAKPGEDRGREAKAPGQRGPKARGSGVSRRPGGPPGRPGSGRSGPKTSTRY